MTEMPEAAGARDPITPFIHRLTRGLGALGAAVTDTTHTLERIDGPSGLEALAAQPTHPAMTVQDILNNPAECAKRRDTLFLAVPDESGDNDMARDDIIESNEYEALRDLHQKLSTAEQLLRAHGHGAADKTAAEAARLLRERLCFIGNKEFEHGTRLIAARWLCHASRQTTSEILLLANTCDSSGFVYEAVRDHVQRAEPGLAERMRRISPDDLRMPDVQAIARRDGLTCIDDWIVTGAQLRRRLEDIRQFVHPEKVRLDFICAPKNVIEEGFYLYATGDRLPVEAAYSFADDLVHLDETGVAVTGAHGRPIWGFGQTVRGIYRRLAEVSGHTDLPLPLLMHPARHYGPSIR